MDNLAPLGPRLLHDLLRVPHHIVRLHDTLDGVVELAALAREFILILHTPVRHAHRR